MDAWEQAARIYERETGRELTAEGEPVPYGVHILTEWGIIVSRKHYQARDGGRVTFLMDSKGEVWLGAD
jgi:hypothetical protein